MCLQFLAELFGPFDHFRVRQGTLDLGSKVLWLKGREGLSGDTLATLRDIGGQVELVVKDRCDDVGAPRADPGNRRPG